MSKYVTDEAMRSAMTLQKGYIDQGDNTNAEGIDSIKEGKNLLHGVLTGSGPYYSPNDHWGSTSEAVQNPTKHEIDVTDGIFSIKETGDTYIVSPAIGVDKGKTYTFRFIYINGGSYEIKIIGVGGYNNHQTQGGGGAGISLTFTAVETEFVRIFVRTDDKKLMFPQLELGSHGSQFVASTEELKDYIDQGDKANAEGIESIEDRMEEVVQTQLITTPPATLNAQVGYYYCMGGSGVVVDTMTIQLPAIADKNKTKNVQFFMTMGSAPEVTFVSTGTERILYQKDFALEAERSYEVNALWNGHAWVITAVEIVVPFFVKLYLNNGEVVELQGSRELTSAMVSSYQSSLVSAEIGELCTSIGDSAFSGCSGLTSITIPNSVTSIRDYAFDGCSGLKKVIVPDIAAWCNIPFGNYAANPLYYAKHIFSDENTEITDLVIPNSVTSIGSNAFSGCSGLTSVTIGNSVTSIGSNAFSGCSGLTSVTIGNSVTSIGNYAFSSCSGLTSITIPNSVISIDQGAFEGCTGLTSITIPDSVTIIGNFAFHICEGLTSVTIGNGVTSIGRNAFGNCTSLTSITSLAAKAPTIQNETFYIVKTGGTLRVPINSTGYDVWMGTGSYYLGSQGWTKVEQ